MKVQENDNVFVYVHGDCGGVITTECISGATGAEPVDCMGYLIAINDRGIDQQIAYSTDSYSLGGDWRGLPLSNIHNNDGRIHLYS